MGVESEGDTVAFTRTLAALKREGSNVLVTGDDVGTAHHRACSKLFAVRVVDRRRAVVSTTAGDVAGHRNSPDTVTWIEYSAQTRGASAARDAELASEIKHDLASLGGAVNDAIYDADRAVGGLAPAQFRLCVDSLGPLLEAHGERAVFRFLHAVTEDVRAADGMGHYHLSVTPGTGTARTLEPLFDAVVELRNDDGPRQRWRLVDENLETGWLSL